MMITYAEPASLSTVLLDKERQGHMCFSIFPQCIQVANFYSYCKENISFLVGSTFFA